MQLEPSLEIEEVAASQNKVEVQIYQTKTNATKSLRMCSQHSESHRGSDAPQLRSFELVGDDTPVSAIF